MVRIPKLKQSNRYDFRSGMSPGVDPGSPHAEGWGQIGQMIGDIAYKLGDAYFKQKEKEEVLASKIVSSDYEKNLKSKISVIMADPANKNKDIVPMVDEVIKNTHAEWFKESKDVNGNPIPNRSSKVDNFNREKFFKTNGETIKTTEQLYRNEGIKFQLIHGAKTYSKTLHANGTAELKNLVNGLDLTSPESRANGLAEVYAKGKGFVTKLLLNQWREENAPEMSEKDFEEFLTQRGAVAGGSGRFFNEFEKWAEGKSSRKSLELHANTIIGTSLKEKVKTAMGKYAADKSNIEKLKTYYDGSVLPQWAKDTIKFIKDRKDLGVDVDDLEKQLKIELKKGYDVLEGIEKKNEREEDKETIGKQMVYFKLADHALNQTDPKTFSGVDLLEQFPGVDLSPEEKNAISRLSGDALTEHLASQQNGYADLRHDNRGAYISSDSPGITIAQKTQSFDKLMEYDNKLMQHLVDATWDIEKGEALKRNISNDPTLLPTDKKTVLGKVERAMANNKLYAIKKQFFGRLYSLTRKMTSATGKVSREYLHSSGFRRKLWENTQRFYNDRKISPKEFVIEIKKFVKEQHAEAATLVNDALSDYEEVQEGPLGVGVMTGINEFFETNWKEKPAERKKELRRLQKEIIERKVDLTKFIQRKESLFSGVKDVLLGEPIRNPKAQRDALEKVENALKLYKEVTNVQVGFGDINEEVNDIGFTGEVMADTIHPHPSKKDVEETSTYPKTPNPKVESNQSIAGEQ